MTIALIDGDLIAYRSAASAEKDEEDIALIRASRMLQDIVSVTDANEIKLFLSGSNNFRYALYPEYKANRKDMKRPRHLETVREFLVIKWGAEVTDGYEADDALGMASSESNNGVVCSLDKDLLQIPSRHYNFVNGEWSEVDVVTGWRNFYSQLVLGDRADNIPGYDGKMRVKWPKFLAPIREQIMGAASPADMYSCVKDIFAGPEEQLIRNARLLYVWRKLNDEWQPPTKVEATLEEKPVEEVKSDSIQTKQGEISRSTGRGSTRRKTGGFRVRGRSKGTSSRKTSRGSSILTSKVLNSNDTKRIRRSK